MLFFQVCEALCSFQPDLSRKTAWNFLKTLSIKSTILDIFGKTQWIVLGPECLCHQNPCFESPIPSVMIFKTRSLWEVVKVLLGLGGGVMAL